MGLLSVVCNFIIYTTNLCKWERKKIHWYIKEMDTDCLSHRNVIRPLSFTASPLLSLTALLANLTLLMYQIYAWYSKEYTESSILKASARTGLFFWTENKGKIMTNFLRSIFLTSQEHKSGPVHRRLCRTPEHITLPTSVYTGESKLTSPLWIKWEHLSITYILTSPLRPKSMDTICRSVKVLKIKT